MEEKAALNELSLPGGCTEIENKSFRFFSSLFQARACLFHKNS
jgi:hypothetical protein